MLALRGDAAAVCFLAVVAVGNGAMDLLAPRGGATVGGREAARRFALILRLRFLLIFADWPEEDEAPDSSSSGVEGTVGEDGTSAPEKGEKRWC